MIAAVGAAGSAASTDAPVLVAAAGSGASSDAAAAGSAALKGAASGHLLMASPRSYVRAVVDAPELVMPTNEFRGR
ncbi:hypothetical protein PF001_g13337 [Phytophthora fragariae]|uniref:Uncharacterized protein n=1 Tax=Phytophthora fragariae TaxID=53985 RepID=A0A6A3TSW3_9STRA|nr:hypothetical protein PF003_g37537 [Phytophthora fragariae]KAE9141984.1 hypothetical protein PF006_g12879 [Phytophthora fragariae]KAE9303895.1 hypothetical protein PF001_g13337 [Phytophthora fragariae]